ncbi:MAG: RNA chaperone Hfq [Nitrosomonadales bacterium]|jgi:host factor-I protein
MPKLDQKQFFEEMIAKNQSLSVYLMNGIKLQGIIEAFDDECIILKANNPQLIYKHAISSIVPNLK